MATRAPSPPDEPPAVRSVLYGLTVTPRYPEVSRCMIVWGLVVSAVCEPCNSLYYSLQ